MPAATVTPIRPTEPTAGEVLRASSTEALVDAVIRLTHLTHAERESATRSGRRLTDLRRQREMVRAELVRRCGR